MEVVNPCAALLSNYEVYKILKETREEQKKIHNNIMKSNLRNLNTIAYETLKYFENVSPCRYSKDTAIPEFLTAVKEYQLSKSELLQLVNLRPTTHVELHAIIEECEERYTETQIASLLDQIRAHLLKNTRPRTSDSVSSYLSPNEDYTPQDPHVLHNSSLSHEEEVVLPTSRKKKKKKVSILVDDEDDVVIPGEEESGADKDPAYIITEYSWNKEGKNGTPAPKAMALKTGAENGSAAAVSEGAAKKGTRLNVRGASKKIAKKEGRRPRRISKDTLNIANVH